jgi:hypothetical protein
MEKGKYSNENPPGRKMVASFTPDQLMEAQDWVKQVVSEHPRIAPQAALATIADKKERNRRRFGVFALGKLNEFNVPWERLDRVFVWRLKTDIGELYLECQPPLAELSR